MQAASGLVDKALSQQSIKSSKPSKPGKLSQALLDKLWLKMTEIYGSRWTGSFGVSADQSHAWAAALGGLTGQQIADGLTALMARDDLASPDERKWPPSAPEFRALCEKRNPEDYGLPTEDQAYREACRRAHPAGPALEVEWSHPAVCHAALEIGFHSLCNLAANVSRKLFARNYQVACRMVMDGKPLKAIPLGLPDPYSVSSVRTEEGGRKGLAGVRAALRGEPENG